MSHGHVVVVVVVVALTQPGVFLGLSSCNEHVHSASVAGTASCVNASLQAQCEEE